MSICESTLGPGLAAYQELTDAGRFCELAPFDDNIVTLCRSVTGEALNRALADADQRVLCAVFCCCNVNPVISETGRSGYQTCATQTLACAEQLMGNDSRFKSEVSFNMRTKDPTPLMEKNIWGNLTTESIPWTPGGIKHIKNRIGMDGIPYESGEARRPDVVIVRDPKKPPTISNISRVIDFKFGDDTLNDEQRKAYTKIGNGVEPLILDEEKCECSDEQETQAQTVLVTAAQDVVEHNRSTMERIGWGVVGAVGAVATVALLLVPFDGPAGEIGAGAGTTAAFARVFAAAGWTAARQRAATAVAAKAWQTIYQGGF